MAKLKYINSNNKSIELGNAAPFLVTTVDGLGSPQNEIYTQKSPYQDGVTATHSSLGPRNIVIEGKIIDSNRENRQIYRNSLLSALNPKLDGKLVIDLGNVKRQIDCKVEQAPYFSSNSEQNYQDFLINLLAPNPYWQDTKETETNLVSWIPNLEFIEGEGFYTEQSPNYWLETQINKGTIELYNNGTVYVEPVLKDKGIYGKNGIEVPLPIENLEEVRVNGWDIDLDTCTIAEDKLSFTSTAAQVGDVVEYVYWYPREITACPTVKLGNNTIEGEIGSVDIAGRTGIRVLGNTETNGEDIKSVIGATRIKSVGKNLFDKRNTKNIILTEYSKIETFDKVKCLYAEAFAGLEIYDRAPIIHVPENNGGINVSGRMFNYDENYNARLNIMYKSGRTSYLANTTNYGWFEFNKYISEPIQCLYIGGSSVDSKVYLDIDSLFVGKGYNYEPYKEDISYILAKDKDNKIVNLRSLPNGIRDEISLNEGKAIINISDWITLDGNENWGSVYDLGNTLRAYVSRFILDAAQIENVPAFSDKLTRNGVNDDIKGFWLDGTRNRLGVKLPKSELETEDANGIKSWLSQNQPTLIYQLAEPETKPLQPQPISPFEEFQSQFGTGEGIELGTREINQIVEIENTGDVDSPIKVVFRAIGDVVNPYIQNMETKEQLRINKTLKQGDKLEITTGFGNKNIYLNGEKAHHYLDFLNSTWLQLSPGTNLIKYDAEHGLNNLECTIYYTPQYLGV